jgi:hypothetical protein
VLAQAHQQELASAIAAAREHHTRTLAALQAELAASHAAALEETRQAAAARLSAHVASQRDTARAALVAEVRRLQAQAEEELRSAEALEAAELAEVRRRELVAQGEQLAAHEAAVMATQRRQAEADLRVALQDLRRSRRQRLARRTQHVVQAFGVAEKAAAAEAAAAAETTATAGAAGPSPRPHLPRPAVGDTHRHQLSPARIDIGCVRDDDDADDDDDASAPVRSSSSDLLHSLREQVDEYCKECEQSIDAHGALAAQVVQLRLQLRTASAAADDGDQVLLASDGGGGGGGGVHSGTGGDCSRPLAWWRAKCHELLLANAVLAQRLDAALARNE